MTEPITASLYELEGEIDRIVNHYESGMLGRDNAILKIDKKLQQGIDEGVITLRQFHSLLSRADNCHGGNGRHPLDLWVNVKKYWRDEKKVCHMVIKALRKKGEEVSFEDLDNPDMGRVRIDNSDSHPDVLFTRNGETIPMDIKILKDQQFKWHDMRRYAKEGAGLIVKCHDKIFLYSPSTISSLYEHGEKNPKRLRVHPEWNKTVIEISSGPKASYNLGELIRLGKIEMYDIIKEINYDQSWI